MASWENWITRRAFLGAAAGSVAATTPAFAQGAAPNWPDRPVRIIVPWPPGGSTDVLARIYAERLAGRSSASPSWSRTAPAPAATSASTRSPRRRRTATRSAPLRCGTSSINQYPLPRACPSTPTATSPRSRSTWELPNVAVVPTQHVPARTLAEFIAWAKAKRGGITYGSPGRRHHAAPLGRAARRARRLRGRPRAVPRRGADHPGDALGRRRLRARQPRQLRPVIQEGRMRALAVTSPTAGRPCRTCRPWRRPGCPTSWSPPGPRWSSRKRRHVRSSISFRRPCAKSRPSLRSSSASRSPARNPSGSPPEEVRRSLKERPMWQEMVKVSGARLE